MKTKGIQFTIVETVHYPSLCKAKLEPQFNHRRFIMTKTRGFLFTAGLVLAMAFTFSCSLAGDKDDDSDYEMLNGVWSRGDIVVTFNNSNAVFTQINSNSGWKTVQNNGGVSIGSKKIRNISGSNLRWTCQELTYDASYVVAGWEDCTIIMDADGQTLQVTIPAAANSISNYTRE